MDNVEVKSEEQKIKDSIVVSESLKEEEVKSTDAKVTEEVEKEESSPSPSPVVKRDRVSERIGELTRHRRVAEERANTLQKRVEELSAKLADAQDPMETTRLHGQVAATETAMQIAKEDLGEIENQTKQHKWQEALSTVSEEYSDYEDVVSKASDTVSEEVASIILNSGEDGARLVYHLAKNPSDSNKLNSLSGRQLDIAVAKILAKIDITSQFPQQNQQVKKSGAPRPIQPITAKASYSDAEEESVEDYIKRRRAADAKK